MSMGPRTDAPLEQSNTSEPEAKRRRRSSSFSSGLYERPAFSDDRELQQLKAKHAKSERELLAASNSLAALQRSSQQEIERLQQQLEDVQEELGEAEQAKIEADHQLKAMQEQHSVSAETVGEQTRVADGLREQVDTLHKLANTRHQEVKELSEELSALKVRHHDLSSSLQQTADALVSAQAELENVTTSKRQLQVELAATQEKLQDTETLLQVSTEAADAIKADRDQQMHEVVARDEAVKALEEQLCDIPKWKQDASNAEQRCSVIEADLVVRFNSAFADTQG